MTIKWESLSLNEQELRMFWRHCADLANAKAAGDRVAAGAAYIELAATEMHADKAAMRLSAGRMIDRAELAWYLDNLEKSAPYELWLARQAHTWAAATKAKKRAIIDRVRSVAGEPTTPESARSDLRKFLMSPGGWLSGFAPDPAAAER